MATRVDIDKDTVKRALEQALASEKRQEKGAKPQFRELHAQEIARIQNAINTLAETK